MACGSGRHSNLEHSTEVSCTVATLSVTESLVATQGQASSIFVGAVQCTKLLERGVSPCM
jgi:hypothetical protein